MPELPEIETIKRQLKELLKGRKLSGEKIIGVERKGKMLFLVFENGRALAFHLKLSGQLIFNGKSSRYTRKVFNFDDGSRLVFNDVRKFAWYKMVKNYSEMKEVVKLGPDGLSVEEKEFKKRLEKRSRSRIKPLLLDQSFIAGIGNIYADEILFAAGIKPRRLVKLLKKEEVKKLFLSMKRILRKAVKKQGSSVKDFLTAKGGQGGYSSLHKVYQKTGKPCQKCKTLIKRIKLGGRGTHYCPKCQR